MLQNDYNQNDAKPPKTKIANWVEERALLESTGVSRGSKAHQQSDTAARTITHTHRDTPEEVYQTAARRELESTRRANEDKRRINEATKGKSRRQLVDQAINEHAQKLVEDYEAQQARQGKDEADKERFRDHPPVNRKNIIERLNKSEGYQHSLEEKAITAHTDLLPHYEREGAKAGHFGKDTTFSQPIDEYKKNKNEIENHITRQTT